MEFLPWGQRGTAAVSIAAGLHLERLTYGFPGREALIDRITADIAPGEIVCLLGKSGSGKTTLLRLIAGLERAHSGRISIGGREVASTDAFLQPEARNIGFVFQDYALFPHLDLIKNVAFGLHHLPRRDRISVAERALARVGLADYRHHYPHHISGGEQQRVALARAIAPRPAMLLMDEPFSGLDLALRETLRQETLSVIRETRATSIIVTHDPEEALRLADRIALLQEGRIIQIGRPKEIFRNPATLDSARFFGELNVMSITINDGIAYTPLGRFAIPGPLKLETRALMSFRPTALVRATGNGSFNGRVIASHFLGERQLLEIVVEGLDQSLSALFPPSVETMVGQDLILSLEREAVRFFPAG